MLENEIDLEEAVRISARDTVFFGFYFFPKTCRQEVSPKHYDLVRILESPSRIAAAQCYRDFAKTSWARIGIAKRISYGLSNTMVFVSETEGASIKTLTWLKKQIVQNTLWVETYGLSPKIIPGTNQKEKWEETWITVHNSLLNVDINIIAIGITGQSRGINIDDFRPDYILVDDPCDEENTKTAEQRDKVNDIVMGSILNSLAPESENPNAKLVVLQTPLEDGDLISLLMKDPTVEKLSVSCFDDQGESTWPARWPTDVLRQMKEAATARGQLRLWMREKEVKIIQGEKHLMKKTWLQDFEFHPEGGYYIISVDPTPPPKETDREPNPRLDDAVFQVWQITPGQTGSHFWLREEYDEKSPDLFMFADKILTAARKYRVLYIAAETVFFQRALKSVLDRAMVQSGRIFRVLPVEDKRKKSLRITQELSEVGYSGRLHVQAKFTKFYQEFAEFPYGKHDDHIDCAATAIASVSPESQIDSVLEGEYDVLEDEGSALEYTTSCP